MVVTLVAQLSFAWLTIDAIYEENAYQLLASTVFAVLTSLLWLVFMVSGQQSYSRDDKPS